MDRRVEQVHADEREVARRIGGLLDEVHDVAGGVEAGDAETVRVGHLLEQDLRGGPVAGGAGGLEGGDEGGQVLFQEVVAEVHDEVVVGEELVGDQHAVGQPEGRVLRDVRDLRTPLGPVTERLHHLDAGVADDHTDLGDAGGDHRLDAVEQDRLVGHRHQLLRARCA